jgi:hypothetical protein
MLRRKLEGLLPAFLLQAEENLLLNRPGLWAVRLPFILFGALLLAGLLALRVFTYQVDLANVSNPYASMGLAFIPAVLVMGVWLFRVYPFSVTQAFGVRSRLDSVRDQVIIGGSVLLLAAIPLSYGWGVQQQLKRAVSPAELAQDINQLELGFRYLNNDHDYRYGNGNFQSYPFEHPGLLANKELRAAYWRNQSKAAQLDVIAKFRETMAKYGGEFPQFTDAQILAESQVETYLSGEEGMYQALDKARRNLRYLQQAQSKPFVRFAHIEWVLILMFAFMFYSAVMVLMNARWKTFVYTGVTAVVLAFLSGITIGIVETTLAGAQAEILAWSLFLGIFGLSLLVAYRRKHTRRWQVSKTVALSLATLMVPLLPLVFMLLLDSSPGDEQGAQALLTGMGLGLLAWNLFFQRRFLKLAAMPSDN